MFLTFRLLPASSDVFLCPRRCPQGGRAAPVPRRPLQRPRCPVPDRPPRALGFAVAAPRCGPNACSCRLSTPGQPPSSLVAYRRGDTYRARNLHFGGTSAEGAPLAPLGIGSKSKAAGHPQARSPAGHVVPAVRWGSAWPSHGAAGLLAGWRCRGWGAEHAGGGASDRTSTSTRRQFRPARLAGGESPKSAVFQASGIGPLLDGGMFLNDPAFSRVAIRDLVLTAP